ncbi:hypothetical protein RJZ56_004846 [Blastomyces dermatitidis]|uniref:Uncharacterized protein n=3 Tax=Blastomyces TaxID=229219 RepID=A0A179UU84_BLAGS|nr:uncharacterized protein BDBG_05649 [Blastomyces gilchristii SLH14081]XP_031579089.1 hypothetical protein, variant [Blastomyces gilchristii SLH14081]XP_045274794.1 hypothetical protein, variant [Blastomyces dermatitidis ER-3]XP_045280106.1 uncharacterized protein BDCG_02604 [Blastomyces dermatitidis ER-3]EGE77930.1 hypothetical protein BDDG_00867 [Blastomyces dermatitidis ATCC 18188]EQL38227.1 hypothetical protein BDFG_00597 [Blastomyces dermatitidis ATCC 26199]EEQ87484.1 hypothetical prote
MSEPLQASPPTGSSLEIKPKFVIKPARRIKPNVPVEWPILISLNTRDATGFQDKRVTRIETTLHIQRADQENTSMPEQFTSNTFRVLDGLPTYHWVLFRNVLFGALGNFKVGAVAHFTFADNSQVSRRTVLSNFVAVEVTNQEIPQYWVEHVDNVLAFDALEHKYRGIGMTDVEYEHAWRRRELLDETSRDGVESNGIEVTH